ncbi:MAG: hypothetical protein B6245_00050 [Desulfobacteraceae bacterium 4572_88]|nr:MAG: hypothetical protein B6245_00050 [Desulfobacteraceae bacterium 4572_88]
MIQPGNDSKLIRQSITGIFCFASERPPEKLALIPLRKGRITLSLRNQPDKNIMLKVLVILAQVLQTDLLKTDQDKNMNRDRYFAC